VATIGMPHIGLGGHLPPAARLGGLLAEAGHRVIAWAPADSRRLVEAPGVTFREHEPAATARPFPSMVHFAAEIAEATERCCEDLVAQMLEERVDLVLHDVHVPWGRVAADFLGLPRVVTNPLFPCRREERGGVPGWGAGFVPGALSEPLDRFTRAAWAVARAWGVELGSWYETVESTAETTLSFTIEELAGDELSPGWIAVGPLLAPLTPPARLSERPLVYVAFGTFFNGRPEPFRAAIEALGSEPVEVLVSTGGGVALGDLGALPENVEVRPFVPSRQVLATAAVHISHGGGGSIHEALVAGVPTLCLPQGSDQYAWADRIAALGAGQVVGQRPQAIRAAVRQVLADDRWRSRAREVGARLLTHPGRERALAAVERALAQAAPAVATRRR
jgi:MGT family glycosyltransferase